MTPLEPESVWPHRWAVALVCATFPLIWVGGLVTTYGAGMAVPDYPTTYGYNPLLYPLDTWINGPWKLFIEHGHRLFAGIINLMMVGFLIAAWRCRTRKTVRWMGLLVLAAVFFQDALGGMRVNFDKVQLARIHGCVGPGFFALTVALAVITSRSWMKRSQRTSVTLGNIERWAVMTTFLAYCQLVLGSFLRHLPAGSQPGDFRVALFFHLAVAAVLVLHVAILTERVVRTQGHEGLLLRPAVALAGLLVLQISLGAGTWVAKYGWPAWLADFSFAAQYVISADSRQQAWITTAHVAIGSLILATSLLVALRSWRFAWQTSHPAKPSAWLMEAAR